MKPGSKTPMETAEPPLRFKTRNEAQIRVNDDLHRKKFFESLNTERPGIRETH